MSEDQHPQVTGGRDVADMADVEYLIVPVFGPEEVRRDPGLQQIDQATGGAVGRACETGEFRAKGHETFVATIQADHGPPRRVVVVGAGDASEPLTSRIRTAAAVGTRLARTRRITTTAFLCRGEPRTPELAQAAAEGVGFGGFVDRRFKREADDDTGPPACQVVWSGEPPDGADAAIRRGNAVARGATLARELANEPANALTPTMFADRAAMAAEAHGLHPEVLDQTALTRLRMGLLLGVARGSEEPPKLLVIRHDPADAADTPMLGLVGKGVTFDSGGISIKPAGGMERMKSDMSGGAAVVGAMCAIGAIGLSRRVIGVVPMTENMPSGRATKPGDILTAASGTTVEVINTDAEGRLILGDALWYARELGATHLVDVATLTGACVVALGRAASGLFGRPDAWVGAVQRAATGAGERVWPLPLYREYREQLTSEMADLANTGGRPGGACTAAAFLEAFAGDGPWAHLDIAGTAWTEESHDDAAPGATGVMVRTLVELALAEESW